MSGVEQEYVECWACGGSGEDDVNWDGLCRHCGGGGEYLRDVPDDDEDYDDDDLCTPRQPERPTSAESGDAGEGEKHGED